MFDFVTDYFISPSGFQSFSQIVVANFCDNVQHLIEGVDVPTSLLDVSMDLVQVIFESLVALSGDEGHLVQRLLPSIFDYGFLAPLCKNKGRFSDEPKNTPSQDLSKALWDGWTRKAHQDIKDHVFKIVKDRLRSYVEGTQYCLR